MGVRIRRSSTPCESVLSRPRQRPRSGAFFAMIDSRRAGFRFATAKQKANLPLKPAGLCTERCDFTGPRIIPLWRRQIRKPRNHFWSGALCDCENSRRFWVASLNCSACAEDDTTPISPMMMMMMMMPNFMRALRVFSGIPSPYVLR